MVHVIDYVMSCMDIRMEFRNNIVYIIDNCSWDNKIRKIIYKASAFDVKTSIKHQHLGDLISVSNLPLIAFLRIIYNKLCKISNAVVIY